MLALVILAALASVPVHGQCYLDDIAATCAVCWASGEDGPDAIGSKCEGAAEIKWTQPPPSDMVGNKSYPVEYTFKISTAAFQPVPTTVAGCLIPNTTAAFQSSKDAVLYQLSHSNIHSCVKSRGACTAFVKNGPHTANRPTNFTLTDDGKYMIATVKDTMELPEEEYTVIVHNRIYVVEEGKKEHTCYPKCLTKYDITVGIPRVVRAAPPASPIAAGAAGVSIPVKSARVTTVASCEEAAANLVPTPSYYKAVVDIRTQSEYAAGKLDLSKLNSTAGCQCASPDPAVVINVPYPFANKDAFYSALETAYSHAKGSELPAGSRILVHCKSGSRARKMVDLLEASNTSSNCDGIVRGTNCVPVLVDAFAKPETTCAAPQHESLQLAISGFQSSSAPPASPIEADFAAGAAGVSIPKTWLLSNLLAILLVWSAA